MEFKVDSTTLNLGIPLKDLKLKKNVLLAVIVRGGTIIIPEGSTTIEVDDNVIIISQSGMITEFNNIFDDTYVAGGGVN